MDIKYNSWASMPLYKFIDLQKLDKEDPDYILEAIAILCDSTLEEIKSLKLSEVQSLAAKLEYIGQSPEPKKLKLTKIKLGDNTYKVMMDFNEFTYSQFVDYDNYTSSKEHIIELMPDILSTIIIPTSANEYNKGYSLNAVIEDIKSMSVEVAVSLFFSCDLKLRKSLKASLVSLYYHLKIVNWKMKNPELKEQLKLIKKSLKEL